MVIDKKVTVSITDDDGQEIHEGDALMFVSADRTHLAVYYGLDNRSRAVFEDYITKTRYACMIGSIKRSKIVKVS